MALIRKTTVRAHCTHSNAAMTAQNDAPIAQPVNSTPGLFSAKCESVTSDAEGFHDCVMCHTLS